MKPYWTPAAQHDRDRIYRYIARDNAEAAIALDNGFDEAVRALTDHPRRGRMGRKPATRELVAHPNYVIVYRLVGDTLQVLRVLHAAQRWP